MTINVTQKEVYGSLLTYVVDTEVQRTIQKLTGRKTLTSSDIQALIKLGFTLKTASGGWTLNH
jgi:hypothetical protein